jgi:P-type E1-E2 ATPase
MKEQETHLEEKLKNLSETITKYAWIATGLIVVTQLIFLAFIIILDTDLTLTSNETVLKAFKIIILAICILIVAIPEGLPLAVSIAMAMSIDRLKHDQLLIKNLEAV